MLSIYCFLGDSSCLTSVAMSVKSMFGYLLMLMLICSHGPSILVSVSAVKTHTLYHVVVYNVSQKNRAHILCLITVANMGQF